MKFLQFLNFFEYIFQKRFPKYFFFEKSNFNHFKKGLVLKRKIDNNYNFLYFFKIRKKNLYGKKLLKLTTLFSIFKKKKKLLFFVSFFKKKLIFLNYLNIFQNQMKIKLPKNFENSPLFYNMSKVFIPKGWRKNFSSLSKKSQEFNKNNKNEPTQNNLLKKFFFLKLIETNLFFKLKSIR